MTTTVATTSSQLCVPRWETPRSPERLSFGDNVIQAADRLGFQLMPWQRQVAMVGGEIDPDTGRPAYRDVVVTVPRQSGKTSLILAWEIQRAIGWADFGPQTILYSAQTGNDARKKLVEDHMPILQRHRRPLRVRRLLRGMGNELVEFNNGSRIILLASAESSGHGKTVDFAVKDELFADSDNRRDQALIPAMATKPYGQVFTASTMGTSSSLPWKALYALGRQAVEEGRRSGIAYFEWSALPDEDPDDPAVWARCMPALGHTIDEQVVRHARGMLSLAEFRRAFLNIEDGRRNEPVISSELWDACRVPTSKPKQPYVMAFDVSPEATGAIAVAADAARRPGKVHVEVVDHRPGTGWMVDRLVELVGRHRPRHLVCDPAGPAGGLLVGLVKAGVEVEPVTMREHAQACVGFADAVREGTLVHIGQAQLDAAVAGADRRRVDDSWRWSRKSSTVDISPLVAVTLARWASIEAPTPIMDESNLSVW